MISAHIKVCSMYCRAETMNTSFFAAEIIRNIVIATTDLKAHTEILAKE